MKSILLTLLTMNLLTASAAFAKEPLRTYEGPPQLGGNINFWTEVTCKDGKALPETSDQSKYSGARDVSYLLNAFPKNKFDSSADMKGFRFKVINGSTVVVRTANGEYVEIGKLVKPLDELQMGMGKTCKNSEDGTYTSFRTEFKINDETPLVIDVNEVKKKCEQPVEGWFSGDKHFYFHPVFVDKNNKVIAKGEIDIINYNDCASIGTIGMGIIAIPFAPLIWLLNSH